MNNRIKSRALEELIPGKWILDGDNVIILDDDITFDHAEFAQKCAEVEYKEELEEYRQARSSAYPPMPEQLDKIFHDGVDAWKADIQAIKDAHPKAVIDNDTLAEKRSQALSDHQLKEYTKAVERLSHYQVSLGREEVTEDVVTGQVWDEDTSEMVDMTEMSRTTVSSIEPVEATVEQTTYDEEGVATTSAVENPLITADVAERAAAQSIVDATPQAVVDTYNV
tara:strand:- start:58 stop:729 length:672 start_codon:yes stop_codon:yes gene_type:complete